MPSDATKPIDAIALLRSVDKTQLDLQIASAQGELKALRTLRKAIAARDGEEEPEGGRKTRRRRRPAGGGDPAAIELPLAVRVERLLRDRGQPMTLTLLARECDVFPGAIVEAVAGHARLIPCKLGAGAPGLRLAT